MERVVWRSKQALDFSFLMMYAQSRATFYVQVNATVWHTFNNAVPIYDLFILAHGSGNHLQRIKGLPVSLLQVPSSSPFKIVKRSPVSLSQTYLGANAIYTIYCMLCQQWLRN
jgi:hypothetical protein